MLNEPQIFPLISTKTKKNKNVTKQNHSQRDKCDIKTALDYNWKSIYVLQ